MNKYRSRKLESFPFFPYVAWTLVIVFALLVYKISVDLERATTALELQTNFRNGTAPPSINEQPPS